jgi:hypothetical protein
MAVEVRPARPDDAVRLAEVYLTSGRAAWAGHLREETLSAFSSPVEEWTDAMADPAVSILVAELDGEIAALATLVPTDDEDDDPHRVARLGRLYTWPAAWGRDWAVR